jgi:hypothetical protein
VAPHGVDLFFPCGTLCRCVGPANGFMNFIEFNINFIDFNKIKVYFHFMQTPLPQWLEAMDEEDLHFLRRFVLGSGSLKALCDEYQVSYPTLRARLDRLIAKVKAAEDTRSADAFERRLRVLVADGKIGPSPALELLRAHRETDEKE